MNAKGKPCGRKCAAGRQFCFGHAASAAAEATPDVPETKTESAPAAGPVSAEKEGAEEEAAEEEAVEEAAEETVDAKICFGCERAPRLAGKLFCTACRKEVEAARVMLNKELVNGGI